MVALLFLGGNMIKKIERKKLSKQDRNIKETNEQLRQRMNEKIELIMDKLDEIIDEINS